MKHSFLTLSFLLSLLMVKGQTKFVTHDLHVVAKGYPYFDGHFVWWDDSTVSYVSYYGEDSLRTLFKRVDFLMRDDLETHRRLDSLLVMMRPPPPPLLIDSAWLKRMIQASGTGAYYNCPPPSSPIPRVQLTTNWYSWVDSAWLKRMIRASSGGGGKSYPTLHP